MATTAVQETAGREDEAGAVSREELIDGLNVDLAAEFQAVLTYRLFASLATGPHRQEIRSFFEGEIEDELEHARFLADKVVALGGEPTTEPLPVEFAEDNREMFEIALQAETDTITRYEARIRQAEALGETALKVELEELLADEAGHKEEIERILTDWHG